MNLNRPSHSSVIEYDARSINRRNDPPGQRSVYVPPGNPERETYRLATFKDFPRIPIDERKLARAGFYFTGYKDRVKCFSCKQCVENWNSRDDPTLRRWHRQRCEFTNGIDQRNISIDSSNNPRRFSSIATQSVLAGNSSQHQQTQSFPETTDQNLLVGLKPTSDMTVPCYSSVYQTATVVDPAPNQFSSERTTTNINCNRTFHTELERTRPTTGNASFFPCHHPINPHMRSEEMRLQTFLDHSRAWPGHRIRASPRDIARAGMFYLGDRDRVKCWYCNGGFQNWERNGDP